MALTRVCAKCKQRRGHDRYDKPGARVCSLCKRSSTRAGARATRLRNVYGITPEEYAEILAAQWGVCGGCGQKRRYNLHVDHDHKVERDLIAKGMTPEKAARKSVRGLLCARCNKVLRDIRDNAGNLHGLADYLDTPPAKAVLR